MGASVNHTFKKGFFIDEERLRKLNSIINQRIKELGNEYGLSHKVYRSDSFTYRTEDIQQIIKEDNNDWQKIERLLCLVEGGDKFDLKLDFHPEETYLEIEGEDRDFVFLCYSDLREYLSNEINVRRRFDQGDLRSIANILILSPFIILFFVFYSIVTRTAEPMRVALESTDPLDKLNFLIDRGVGQSSRYDFGFMLFIVTVLGTLLFREFGVDLVNSLVKRIYPPNIFLFGKEMENENRRRAFIHNVIWGIVVASIIGVATGLIVWRITK